jgi:membrane-associated phospholipid phosphatase
MALAFIAITVPLVWPSWLVELDVFLRDLSDANRPEWAEIAARVAIYTGQGGLISGIALALAGVIALKRRSVRPMIAFLATYVMVGSILVLKWFTDRPAPHYPGEPPYIDVEHSILFSGLDPARSYPSGHAINTIVWYGFMVLLIGALMRPWLRRVFIIAPPVIAAIAMTYLGWHWFTDAPAGIFIGVVILRIVQRIPWAALELPGWLEPERRYV